MIFTASPARHITNAPDSVTVYTDYQAVKGKYVVVAMPPHLSGRITYNPPLPARRAQLTQRFPMGTTVKCIGLFNTPVSPAGVLAGVLAVHTVMHAHAGVQMLPNQLLA